MSAPRDTSKAKMVLSAINASMGKFGMHKNSPANASKASSGQGFLATKLTNVLEIKYGIPPFPLVFAPITKSGTEENVLFNPNVVEEEFSIKKNGNVTVPPDTSGLSNSARDVLTDKGGMKLKEDVDVPKEQSGIETDAELPRLVEMAKSGIKIYGNVSVHWEQCSTEFTVCQIHAKMGGFGMMKRRLVSVDRRKYGMEGGVFLPKSHVQMERYGTH